MVKRVDENRKNTGKNERRLVHSISEPQQEKIKGFLRGWVDRWYATEEEGNPHQKKFKARNFVGGENRDWTDHRLDALFKAHREKVRTAEQRKPSAKRLTVDEQHKKAEKAAGRSLGWIFFGVLAENKRYFFSFRKDVAEYELVSAEEFNRS